MLRVAQQWWNHGWNPLETWRDDFFPGAQPVSIERKHFGELKDNEYAVCEKADGERVFAMWTNGKSYLIDRKCRVTEFHMKGVPPKFMDGTLLDCEKTDTHLLVFDAARVCGEPCSNAWLWERQALIKTWVSKCLRVKHNPWIIKQKPHWKLCPEGVRDFLGHVASPRVVWGIDGLIFTPVKQCLDTGTQNNLFKWKPLELITIDFHVEKGSAENKWKLFLQTRGNLVFQEEVWSDSPLMESGNVVEFRWDDGGWKAWRDRPDKAKPNGIFTYQRTMVNIKEGITDDELLGLDEPSKIAYLKCHDEQ